MLKLSIVTSSQDSAFQGAEAVHCDFSPSLGSFLPAFLVCSLFLIFPSLACYVYLFIFCFSHFPSLRPLPFSVQPRASNLWVWTAFANSSVRVLAECKPDGPAVPTVISQPTLASLPLSFLPWQERNICLYLGRLVFAAVPLP